MVLGHRTPNGGTGEDSSAQDQGGERGGGKEEETGVSPAPGEGASHETTDRSNESEIKTAHGIIEVYLFNPSDCLLMWVVLFVRLCGDGMGLVILFYQHHSLNFFFRLQYIRLL